MNVQRIERVAYLMRHTRGQQRQRLDAFAFDRFECFLPRLRRVVQDQRHAGTAGRFAIQRCRIQSEKAVSRILYLKFMPHNRLSPGAVPRGQFFPVQLGQIPGQVVALAILRFQSKQMRDRLVEIDDPPLLVHHEHMTVNVITRRGRKKHGGSTNVVRFSPSRCGDAFENLTVANFIALQCGGVVSAHVARRDRVHVHALRCPFVGQRFG